LKNGKAILMTRRIYRRTIVFAIVFATICQQATSYAAALRTVALTGQPAAGTTTGVSFDTFGTFVHSVDQFIYGERLGVTLGRVAVGRHLRTVERVASGCRGHVCSIPAAIIARPPPQNCLTSDAIIVAYERRHADPGANRIG
jgi:hypothetical protein